MVNLICSVQSIKMCVCCSKTVYQGQTILDSVFSLLSVFSFSTLHVSDPSYYIICLPFYYYLAFGLFRYEQVVHLNCNVLDNITLTLYRFIGSIDFKLVQNTKNLASQ